MRTPSENDVRRVAQLLSFDRSREDIVEKLSEEGLNAGDAFLAYAAGLRFFNAVSKCDHGMPLRVSQHLSGSRSVPDIANCAGCRADEEKDAARREAEADALIARIVSRQKRS